MRLQFIILRVGLVALTAIIGTCLAYESTPVAASSAPPTTSVVFPANDRTLSGSQYFDAAASPGTTEVQFEISGSGYIDHVIATATPTIYGWLASVNTSSFYDATYVLQSVATSEGVVVTSPGVSVTFNNPGPAVSIVMPSGGSRVNATQYLDALTGTGVWELAYTLTGNGIDDQIIGTGSPTLYGWVLSWDTTLVPNGIYSLQAIADANKGPAGFSDPLTITVDNPAPTTSVVVLADGSTVSGLFYVNAVASAGASTVMVLFSGGPENWSPRLMNGSAKWIYGWLTDLNSVLVPGGMPNGVYTVQSVACSLGFVCGTSAPVTITLEN